jgi:GH24 family phage-related lysozyme (muramidase)
MDAHPLPSDISACLNLTAAITEEMADRLLNISIASAEAACRDLFQHFNDFSERRQAALIDMIFNLGVKGVMAFRKMRAAIDEGNWNEAAHQVNDSAYWRELGGDPMGTDDGKFERPEEIAKMLRDG